MADHLRLVFCGTAPSRASAAAGAYYAKPGNRFWPALAASGLTPRRFAPGEFRELLSLGIGLTDLCKHHAGVDAELPANAFDVPALKARILTHAPRWLAFTSKHAATKALGGAVSYGVQETRWGSTRIFVLCSPSGLATRHWNPDLWTELGRTVGSP